MKIVDAQRTAQAPPTESRPAVAASADKWEDIFHADLAADTAVEKRLFFREGWIVLILALLVLLREMLR